MGRILSSLTTEFIPIVVASPFSPHAVHLVPAPLIVIVHQIVVRVHLVIVAIGTLQEIPLLILGRLKSVKDVSQEGKSWVILLHLVVAVLDEAAK